MNIFISIAVFFFGAIIGSFLNVVILRYNTGQFIFFDRSKCFSCGKKLRWFELAPIFSFIWQEGRCGSCKAKISWQYPIIEIITGLMFLQIFNLAYWQAGFQFSIINELSIFSYINIVYFWFVFSILITIAVYDYRHQIIPDLPVWIFNGLAFLSLFGFFGFSNWNLFGIWKLIIENFNWDGFGAGFILFSFFAFLWLVSRGHWMGFGDAKLALGIGWMLGIGKGLLALALSFWIGAAVSIFLLWLTKRKYNMKSSIAFGPFLVMGAAVSFFYGEKIINFLLQRGSF